MLLDARFRGHDGGETTDFFSELLRHHTSRVLKNPDCRVRKTTSRRGALIADLRGAGLHFFCIRTVTMWVPSPATVTSWFTVPRVSCQT